MSIKLGEVKYPRLYFQMVQRCKEYEKEAKVRLDAQVRVYRAGEYSQYQLERLIPRRG